ncbi:hypothetical protein SAMN04488038_102221 [Solimonas aquatica]|uniref:Uncharacterized protein n=1 Tax=Solimonas aquatica TaxID=489703 RepID=A0A1H9BU97_9GAMM|nr:DUF6447 family protein [Solimonas aquatica]SEP92301.1 hypothetical protein SAMN04488038_102221 [Solimonas aquatica]
MAKVEKQVAAKQAPVVAIDGQKYEWAKLSKEARAAVININTVDAELKRLRVQVGIAQTARKLFVAQLRGSLAKAKNGG